MNEQKSDYEDWRESLLQLPPLHMSDVAEFLRLSNRSEVCPFCSYAGQWDFHVRWPDDEEQLNDDPLMSVYIIQSEPAKGTHECVAITCPNCAHFSLLDVNRIKMRLLKEMRRQDNENG